MTTYTNIADAAAARHRLGMKLAAHLKASSVEEARIRKEILSAQEAIALVSGGVDLDQVQIAESVLDVYGVYASAGNDRASVITDAIAEIATGAQQNHKSLWSEYFGTKSYAHWHGQRCDCTHGYGPSHGSMIFSVGYRTSIRARDPRQLSEAERIACVYYLANLEAIQAFRQKVAA
ncbi:hypothetical protein ABQW67_19790 [Xanthomonas hortorum]|uniref:hypothetical protein n=1 Tax=Xanthomonas hortorum TaxID=56454 RepID=UPI0015D63AF7|nr:hypothetical protein [Xanthomonas hortorum]MCC8492392.1 hypothetical protein [Xanthomonas hortorum pv. gardneri]MCE4343965.1 hypothetical protein [Xanthomonas hortorum pv. vitians]MCE4530978.1 hypothetical protein [Xanthomonas hortorum pv. vitians]NMI20067.1 hypothetical protein [Xanthomonas hortorum pv. vitians]